MNVFIFTTASRLIDRNEQFYFGRSVLRELWHPSGAFILLMISTSTSKCIILKFPLKIISGRFPLKLSFYSYTKYVKLFLYLKRLHVKLFYFRSLKYIKK